jgi:hypothetical protein
LPAVVVEALDHKSNMAAQVDQMGPMGKVVLERLLVVVTVKSTTAQLAAQVVVEEHRALEEAAPFLIVPQAAADLPSQVDTEGLMGTLTILAHLVEPAIMAAVVELGEMIVKQEPAAVQTMQNHL